MTRRQMTDEEEVVHREMIGRFNEEILRRDAEDRDREEIAGEEIAGGDRGQPRARAQSKRHYAGAGKCTICGGIGHNRRSCPNRG